jgi:ureidoacrylate peracid hydrolase
MSPHPVHLRPETRAMLTAQRGGALHVHGAIDPTRTALVVIDMQNAFCEPGAPAEIPAARLAVGAINRVAALMRQTGGRVIWVTHENRVGADGKTDWPALYERFLPEAARPRMLETMRPGAPGTKLWGDLEDRPEDLRVVKNRFSALINGSSSLERSLRGLGVETVIVAGTKTDVCCESTARDAMMLDFNVIMLADGCATATDEDHLASLESLARRFADVMTADEVAALIDP